MLTQHDEGTKPLKRVGMDFFKEKNHTYLVSVDFYTYFIEVDPMSTTMIMKLIKT